VNLAQAFANVLREFKIESKILSVTCDNASNNDTMMKELADTLTGFSTVNRTRCFAHILNLVAKSLLKQFDVKLDKKRDDDLNDDEQSLLKMAEDIEVEERTTAQEKDDADVEADDEDNEDGWVDEVEVLTPKERKKLKDSIRPVKRTLVKVRNCAVTLTWPQTVACSCKNLPSR
jgi:hypothetical protein